MAYSLCYILLIISLQHVSGDDLSSLTFVIDDTQSMSDDINAVRAGANDIFNTVLVHRNESQIDNFILVTFNDRSPTDECDVSEIGSLRANTREAAEFREALDKIHVGGGAIDCEECSMAGIKRGLEESRPRSNVYVFTDATSKDYRRYEEVKKYAQEKECQIVFVLTGLCHEPTTSAKYRVYEDVAEATGGDVFHIDKHSVDKVLKYVEETIKGRLYDLKSTKISPGSHHITFDADVLTGEVLFSMKSTEKNNPFVIVKAPDGSGVFMRVIFTTDKSYAYAFNVTQPGTHTIEVSTTAEAQARVSARSDKFESATGFASIKLDSLLDTSSMPAPGAKTHLMVKLNKGDIPLKSVQLLDINNNLLMNIPLTITNNASNVYATEEFDPPKTTFKIAIIGYDAGSNSTIRRIKPIPTVINHISSGETIPNKPASVVIADGPKINANYDKPLELICRVEGYPKPDIVWKNLNTGTVFLTTTRPGKDFSSHVNVLSIERVTENATYSCEAKNAYSDSKQVTVEVIRPRYLKVTSPAEITTVEYEKEGTIVCAVDAYPPADITWYKDDKVFIPGDNVEILVTRDNTVMTIKHSTLADEGKYTCEAKNEDTKQTVDIEYIIVGLEKPEINKRLTDATVLEGLSITIVCKILKGKPKPSISWYFRPGGNDEDSAESFNEILEWQDKESVILKNAEKGDSGVYQCRAENEISTDYIDINVIVEYPPTIPTTYKGEANVKFVKGKVGSKIYVPCYADGIPKPHITWLKNSKNGVQLVNDGRPYTIEPNDSLSFDLQRSLRGIYVCKATNKLDSVFWRVRVYAYDPITIEEPKTNTFSLPVGSNKALPCKASGFPEPKIKWTYQGFGDDEPSKILKHSTDKSLQLRHIQINEAGKYTCLALNSGDSKELTYEIQVFAPPAIVEKYVEKIFVAVEGDLALKIDCKAVGSPTPTLTWTKGGLNLALGSNFHVEEGTLYITDVPEDASGLYTCEAENEGGKDAVTYEVIVQKYPPHNRGASTIFIKEGQSEEISCPLPHRITDQIRWYKDDVLIRTGELTITDASERDSGYYGCRVSTHQKSHNNGVRVIVGYEPKFKTVVDENINMVDGVPVSLDCETESIPDGHTTWYHDDEVLDSTDPIYYFPDGLSSPGDYKCEVENRFGKNSRTFHATQLYCVLQASVLVINNNQAPLMLNSNLTWLTTEKSDESMILPKDTQVTFFCPNEFTEFPKKYITAFCDGGSSFLINGEKYDYSDIKCTAEVKNVIQRTKIICMPEDERGDTELLKLGYKVLDNAITAAYEVCYNKISETPIYAKQIIKNSLADDEYETSWSDDDQFQIDFIGAYECNSQINFISRTLGRWFHNVDKCCFSKRQLVSPKDVFPGVPQKSTFSYFNVVPHWSTCNVQNWDEVERRVRNYATDWDSLVVWTGTAQQLSLRTRFGRRTNIAISDVNGNQQAVPLFLWKVIQNPVTASSLAIIQVNVPDLTRAEVSRYVLCRDVCDSISWMKNLDWHDPKKGYTYCCRLNDFETAFGFQNVFELNMESLTL